MLTFCNTRDIIKKRSSLGSYASHTEGYRSGDVAERCRWQIKRGIRSGSGRNFVSESEQKISGTATGHNEAEPRKFNIEC